MNLEAALVGRPTVLVGRMVGRRSVRWGGLWGLLFGFYIAESALGYKSVGDTPAARERLAQTLGTNKGMAAVFGPAYRIDTIGGFTAWRSLGFLSALGAIIGLLWATRLLRGEEEAGRWELLLVGQTTRRRAALQALAGMAAGLLALGVVTAVLAILGGRSATPRLDGGGMLLLSVAAMTTTGVFMGVGALMSQLAATRRQATSLSALVLGICFLVRSAADSVIGLRWARWATPLSWPSLAHPFTGARPTALLLPLITIAVLAVATVAIADRRDLGTAALPSHDSAPARTRLLGGHAGLALRLMRGVGYGWTTALAITGLFLGLIAQSASDSVSGSEAMREAMARLGAHRSGAESYLGLAFVTVTAMIGFAAAGMVTATRDEEASSRLDSLLVRPVGRVPWLAARVGVAAAFAVLGGLVAGLGAWAGAAAQHTHVGFTTMIAAGLNTVPPALFLLGLGTLVHGLAPRLTAIAVYGLLGWAFVVEMIGSVTKIDHWLLDTSILHHVTPAPAADPNWTSAAALTALGVATAALGAAALRRRDLAGT